MALVLANELFRDVEFNRARSRSMIEPPAWNPPNQLANADSELIGLAGTGQTSPSCLPSSTVYGFLSNDESLDKPGGSCGIRCCRGEKISRNEGTGLMFEESRVLVAARSLT